MSTRDEFAKVQFEKSDDEGTGSDFGDDDDMETVLSDMEAIKDNFDEEEIKPRLKRSDADDENFGIDAIKYAIFTKWQHEDGGSEWMWRYNVMWTGYLQSGYDQLEGIDSIGETDDPDEDQVRLFWRSFDTSATPFLRLKKGEREPPSPPKKFRDAIFDCPASRMRIWLAETNGQRLYKTFLARRQWEKNHPDELRVPKKVSDYYVWKKNQRRKVKEKKKEKEGERLALADPAKGKEKEGNKSSSGSKEPTANATQRSLSKEDAERQDRYKLGAPGERPANVSSTHSPPKAAPKVNATAGPSRVTRVPSPGDEGLSDFDSVSSLFGSDKEADKTIATQKSQDYDKKRKLDPDLSASTSEKKLKKKKHKSRSTLQIPVPLPLPPPTAPAPTAPAKRLDRFDKIKKRTENDAPYDLTMSEMIRAPTPSFGEPVLGIFEPAPPVLVQAPTPVLSLPASVPSRPAPPVAQAPNLLDSVLASLRASHIKQAPTKPPSPPPSAVHPTLDPGLRPPPIEPPLSSSIAPTVSPEPLFTPVTPALPPTEVKPDLATRPKYQQPVKMKFIDNSTPSTSKATTPVARKSSASDPPAHSTLPMRSPRDIISSPMGTIAGRSPMDPRSLPSPQNSLKSPLHPGQSPLSGGSTPVQPSAQYEPHAAPFRPIAPPQPTRNPPPTQPRNFVPPPSGQGGYGSRGSGPLPDQKQVYHGNSAPTAPKPILKAPPTGPSKASTSKSGPAAQSFAPRKPGNLAVQPSSSYDPALDPRAGLVTPPITQSAQLLPGLATQYNPTADPRRRAGGSNMPTPSEASSTPNARNTSPRSPGSDSRSLPAVSGAPPRMETICDFRAYIPLGSGTADFAVKALQGDALRGPDLIRFFLGSPNSTKIAVNLEEIDGVHLQGTLGLGGRLVQWARLVRLEEKLPNAARKSDWEMLKAKVAEERKVYVTYTDYLPKRDENGVSTHYAIIIASPYLFDLSGDSSKGAIGMGSWAMDQIKVGVFVVALPLSSIPAPRLPNPVRPFFEQPADTKPPIPPYQIPLLDSFGMDPAFMRTLQDRTVMKYPPDEGPTDNLHKEVINALKQCGARAAGNESTDVMLIMNQKWGKTLKSSTIRSTLSRRTAFYALGPDLRLYPSQWKSTRIWQSGGLVTFSPTFILRSPAKFADIMSMVRTVNTWGAYILPSAMEWCHRSWSEPARCPDPTKAFDALSRSLFLDQHLLRLSGSPSASGGGLAVSCAPPGVHQVEACTKWMDWLRKIDETKEYDAIVDLCLGVAPVDFLASSEIGVEKKESSRKELELVDIERSQLEDLIAMRSRPHLLPYRRYIHIGELSLDQNARKQYAAEIEFVAADDFAAIFSGAL